MLRTMLTMARHPLKLGWALLVLCRQERQKVELALHGVHGQLASRFRKLPSLALGGIATPFRKYRCSLHLLAVPEIAVSLKTLAMTREP